MVKREIKNDEHSVKSGNGHKNPRDPSEKMSETIWCTGFMENVSMQATTKISRCAS